MSVYPEWCVKYIEYKSLIDCYKSDTELSKELHISRQEIYKYKRKHKEIDEIIASNLRKQINKLGNEAMKALYHRIRKSDKALQLALEIAGIYTSKSEIVNRYDTMSKEDIVKDIKRQFKTLTTIE